MAHRGLAHFLLNRARNLIIHDPAHRGVNGAAMPTDEDDQDGHFLFNHPERGYYPAQPLWGSERGFPELELELIQPHMAQKPVLRGEVGCACVAREVSVERGGIVRQGL